MHGRLFLLLYLGYSLTVSCGTTLPERSEENTVTNAAPVSPVVAASAIPSLDTLTLCKNLQQIKKMPFETNEISGDPIYDGLIAKGHDAIPCLVKRIVDTTVIDDPREVPHIHDFRVGDAAVFMLNRITGVKLEDTLPPAVAERFPVEGVYAYFNYVEKLKNRRQIQSWWKDWLEKHPERNQL